MKKDNKKQKNIIKEEINHPARYNRGDIECIDAMEYICSDFTSKESVSLSNAIKYIWRCNDKGGYQDLDKAIWYLKRFKDKKEEKVLT
ncbi:DUF3310 domain-containing protein [Peptostreptococcus faecalis]|uniref:DUF3310 domain-containing protein n=1 Tax=Peptostreptococcus faecalis TaxID=2045015 RepID=UPI001A9A4FE4|nr:DUF3310 domain-containing protein [Peptostreptococcus faecalis]